MVDPTVSTVTFFPSICGSSPPPLALSPGVFQTCARSRKVVLVAWEPLARLAKRSACSCSSTEDRLVTPVIWWAGTVTRNVKTVPESSKLDS